MHSVQLHCVRPADSVQVLFLLLSQVIPLNKPEQSPLIDFREDSATKYRSYGRELRALWCRSMRWNPTELIAIRHFDKLQDRINVVIREGLNGAGTNTQGGQ
jgi:hypothetical protein